MSEKRDITEIGGEVPPNKRHCVAKSSEAEFAAAEEVFDEDFHCILPSQKEVDDERAAKRVDPRQLTSASVEFMAVREFNELTEDLREQSTLARFSAYIYLRNKNDDGAIDSIGRERLNNKRWTILQCCVPLPADKDDPKKANGGHFILAVIDKVNKKVYVLDSMERKGLSSELGDRLMEFAMGFFGGKWTTKQVNCTQQTNGFDCGVYMPKFISYFFRWLWDNTATCFSSESMENPSVRQQLLIDFSQRYARRDSDPGPADIKRALIEDRGDAESEMTSSACWPL